MALTGIIQRYGTKQELTDANHGNDRPRQGELVFTTDTGEFGYLDEHSNLTWINFKDYFKKDDFVSVGGDASDAGKPVKLNSDGYIDESMVKKHAYQLVDEFTPIAGLGTEYPDPTAHEVGSFWVIKGVDSINGFTFSYGDLNNEIVYNGDNLIISEQGWLIIRGAVNPDAYYKLDGSKAIIADFNAGGFKISNMGDGVALDDAVTVAQWNTKFDGLASNGMMKIEEGADFVVSSNNDNLFGYGIVSGTDPLFPNGTVINIGTTTSAIDIHSTLFQPLKLKNDTAIQAWDDGYTGVKNLVSRTPVYTNTSGDYNNDIHIGDSDVLTAIRATSGFDPVVRKGVYGDTTDYKIYTSEHFNILDYYTKSEIDANTYTKLEADNKFATKVALTAGLNTKLDLPQGSQQPLYAVTSNSANNGIVWTLIDKNFIGLGNVENLAPSDMPVSTEQKTYVDAHALDTNNPHQVTKSQIGLSNVDNTADIDKPISTATQTALNGKEDSLGNPTTDGAYLTSLSDGTRVWKETVKTHFAGDGSNNTFTITGVNLQGTEIDVYVNGAMKISPQAETATSLTAEYTVTNNGADTDVTISAIPSNGDWIMIEYKINA